MDENQNLLYEITTDVDFTLIKRKNNEKHINK